MYHNTLNLNEPISVFKDIRLLAQLVALRSKVLTLANKYSYNSNQTFQSRNF